LQKSLRQYGGNADADVHDNTLFKWANLTFEGGLRQRAAEYGGNRATVLKFADLDDLLHSVLKYAKREGDKFWTRRLQHVIEKKSRGLGFWDNSLCVIKNVAPAIISKSIEFCIHPVKDRWITVREAMTLMGLPYDFDLAVGVNSLGGGSITTKYNHICQNVPVNTAAAVIDAIVRRLDGRDGRQRVGIVVRYDVVKQTEVMETP
jgi:site-specific DNA-cytosine methylase